jgi:hypothetical protein
MNIDPDRIRDRRDVVHYALGLPAKFERHTDDSIWNVIDFLNNRHAVLGDCEEFLKIEQRLGAWASSEHSVVIFCCFQDAQA